MTRPDRMTRAALVYAERLRWAVFPLQGKIPLKGTRGVLDATKDPEKIREWWGRPGLNLGIAGGPGSGVWFLDIDPRHGGARALEALESIHGDLPETPIQETGGADHGRHVVFAWPDDRDITTSSGDLPAGIDVRGRGGYVVGTPSVHPETSDEYCWMEDAHPLRIKPAAAPEWLLDLIAPKGERATQRRRTPEEWYAACQPIKAGEGRHERLLSIAGKLIPSLGVHAGLELLTAWNCTLCRPPLNPADFERVVNHVIRKELEK